MKHVSPPKSDVSTLDFKNTASVISYVKKTVKGEASRASILHLAACASIFQAATYGNVDALQVLHDGLGKNDQTALRMWLGKHSTYAKTEKGHPLQFLSINKGKFAVKNGIEKERQSLQAADDSDTGIRSVECFLVKNVREPDPFELVDLLAKAEGFGASLFKLAEKNGIEVPESLAKEIKRLSAIAAGLKSSAMSAAIH